MTNTVSDAAGTSTSGGFVQGGDRRSLRLGAPSVAGAAFRGDESVAAFVEFVLGDEGQAILADYGFGAP